MMNEIASVGFVHQMSNCLHWAEPATGHGGTEYSGVGDPAGERAEALLKLGRGLWQPGGQKSPESHTT